MSQAAKGSGLIDGLDKVEAWFGRVPDFRDAKLMAFTLDSKSVCRIAVQAWLAKDGPGVNGHPMTEKHATVVFTINEVFAMSVSGYGEGTVFSRLYLREENDHVVMAWDPSWGIGGEITGKSMQILLTPIKTDP
ncbi:MAG: hypothetical protein AAGB15_07725 [Pseudomonadota bacterium]